MKIDDIRALARIMKENGLTGLKIDEEGMSIELKREVSAAAPQAVVPTVVTAAPTVDVPASQDTSMADDDDIFTVTSPMVGMFYAAPSPKDAPYVAVGSKVKSGDILCIVEAMKLMNEITCEVDGTIDEICVKNEQVVEFGQPLFRIRRD